MASRVLLVVFVLAVCVFTVWVVTAQTAEDDRCHATGGQFVRTPGLPGYACLYGVRRG